MNSKSRSWEKKEDTCRYATAPRQNSGYSNFPLAGYAEKCFTHIYGDATKCAGAHPDGIQHGDLKPTEASVSEYCYESENLSLEELKKAQKLESFS